MAGKLKFPLLFSLEEEATAEKQEQELGSSSNSAMDFLGHIIA